ncbi:phospho-N-acetylmuramoyl-pentapeptide-transferase [Aciditerrimonas ferrireducens]|uniref:phospho-N-acetylmuramoyl-pentapeptide- transferase n=1 Tax=Aciditerrimonas ferrireducens TaxID=667306 RepID=UPI00200389CA|nr:phospho-N-acetylmuramoyl-pentapeptide-transferase [Aciditerrimonas ferrireducens]MCK4178207.1 phospho-N-acetylmuramoyl-pentapeptide-transferase [Aciditerrimonas ferrireducens]
MVSLMLSGGVALIVALAATSGLIGWLAQRRIGQQIREDGPKRHLAKAGTPTMGGLAILAGVLAGYLVAHLDDVGFSRAGILVVATTVAAGGIGLVDDWIKVRHRRSLGLNKRAKFGAQLAVAVGFALAAEHWARVPTVLSFTRVDLPGTPLGSLGWLLWAVVIVVGAANAVNLTDGLDGLASGSATFGFAVLAVIGYWQFRHPTIYRTTGWTPLDLALVAVGLAGASLGFLWWNAAPARIFMGDTGSLALGAGLGALGLLMNVQLLLVVIGGLFVIVTLSVVAQVVAYRVFGRRILRMAPLHHHFELKGWPETTVIVRFWILAGLFAALGLGLFYAGFLSATGIR